MERGVGGTDHHNSPMNIMNSVTLYYRDGASDKVYQSAIEPSGSLFLVTFAYGRRGATLQTGVKTPEPVDFSTAKSIFDKLVREKTAKGYTPGESGAPYEGSTNEAVISGIHPQLLNTIDEAQAFAFARSRLWCLQEKMDGRRLLVKKEGAAIQGINRRGLLCGLPSVVLSEIRVIEGDFTLDGEIVGEIFHVFDLLSCNGKSWMSRQYQDRLNALEVIFSSGPRTHVRKIETFYGADEKRASLQQLQQRGAEGIVFKLLSAPYEAGRPASGGFALKFKFTTTGSFIVAGVNNARSVSLKLIDQTESCGNVTIPPNHAVPNVGAIVEVRYLYAFRGGSLYQPVYLGERDDIDPTECVVNQLKFKQEEADNDGE